MNIGFDTKEIEKLRAECKEEGLPYVLVLDEEGLAETEAFAHFQFIGKYEGKEVIYDAVLTTLEFEYQNQLFEMAAERLAKQLNISIDDVEQEKYDEELYDIMDEIEEENELMVSEKIEIDVDFEFGIGIDVILNTPEITHETIVDFIEEFNRNTLKLDDTLYSFQDND
jgi:hypothetical protein